MASPASLPREDRMKAYTPEARTLNKLFRVNCYLWNQYKAARRLMIPDLVNWYAGGHSTLKPIYTAAVRARYPETIRKKPEAA